jgi:transposase-like protein
MKTFNTILELCEKLSTEAKCIEFFIILRWKDGVECPHCQSKKVYTLKNGKSFRCGNTECRETFSIRTGTVMEASNISIKKWILAIYLATSNKKGISSVQLGKHIGISQQSAWFMLHRIREAKGIKFKSSGMFSGTTEIDECYVGGSDSNKHTNKKFTSQKTAIIGLVNRDTKQAKAFVVENADKECLLPKIGCNVEEKSVIVTDSYHAYNDLRNNCKHKSVKHSANEYVRNEFDIDGRVPFQVHTIF